MMKWLYRLLFLLNAIIVVFRSGYNAIGGDEVAAYISLVPFFHALGHGQFFPGFLAFFHEPLFQIVQLTVLFFGANQFFVRLPNMIAAMALFIILYKIGRKLFGKKDLYILVLLLLYLVNGYFRVYRAELNHSFFNLGLLLAAYFLIQQKVSSSYSILLTTCFVYIDAVFTLPGFFLYYLKSLKNWPLLFTKQIMLPSLIAGTIVIIWALAVFSGSYFSQAYDWHRQAPFALLARGTAYSLSAVGDNARLFLTNNSTEYIVFLFGFMLLSLLDKRSRPIWALLVGPLIYFNLVKMPTVHLLNFFTLFLVTAAMGVRFFSEQFPRLKVFVLAGLAIALFSNVASAQWYNPFHFDSNYQKAATYLRAQVPLCDRVYTNIDGYTFRFYFNRAYTNSLAPDIHWAVVTTQSKPVNLPSFKEKAVVAETGKNKLVLFERDYEGNLTTLTAIDPNLFSFSNTLTFITACR